MSDCAADVHCSRCESGVLVPILYGMPGLDDWASEQRGEIVIGGCLRADDSPTHRCNACGHESAVPEPRVGNRPSSGVVQEDQQ